MNDFLSLFVFILVFVLSLLAICALVVRGTRSSPTPAWHLIAPTAAPPPVDVAVDRLRLSDHQYHSPSLRSTIFQKKGGKRK